MLGAGVSGNADDTHSLVWAAWILRVFSLFVLFFSLAGSFRLGHFVLLEVSPAWWEFPR
jgi:hypothetical protein